MAADIEQVTRLQSLDLKIAELEREVATLPKHITQIEKALDSHLRRLEADRAALQLQPSQDAALNAFLDAMKPPGGSSGPHCCGSARIPGCCSAGARGVATTGSRSSK